ncbi:hypothetical protein PORY_000890 [Pneumocystis oryctolagi]|uniref:Uncharacterized protein n=1 Tax=Pneumocystis oryctolagi TaxID=42067 RepID=A0ACB7CFX0_9ASCO|nr:hypothetical protein PORY_000890 [Pneumocystis oryctolagi]
MKLLFITFSNTHFSYSKRFNRFSFPIFNTLGFICPFFLQKTIKIANFSDRKSTKSYISVLGNIYPSDQWTNVGVTILQEIERKLHLQTSHPLGILRKIIESQFSTSHYEIFNDISPIVNIEENFDFLGFSSDHPDRSRSNTYYINQNLVLRTHTSAHQIEKLKKMKKDGFIITADVYRRDEIDKTHYPIFHQMEGVRVWSKTEKVLVMKDIEVENINVLFSDVIIEDTTPLFHKERNPLQANHQENDVEMIVNHLKRTIEKIIVHIYKLSFQSYDSSKKNIHFPLKIRWVESYFPFTSPSWELEIFWKEKWIEVCGCGIIKHELFKHAGTPNRIGWAFGLGLERLAMIFFEIHDIRLFWSKDPRFLKQFSSGKISTFQPYSKYPLCYKDIAFWINENVHDTYMSSLIKKKPFHENDFMEIVRNVGGNLIEEVKLIDKFIHSKTKRKSMCYRINYRSMDRSLSHEEVNELQEQIRELVSKEFYVELR